MEELTEAQRAELEGDLIELQRALEEALALSTDGARPVELDEPIGRVSRMDAIQQQKMVRAGRDSQRARLRLVRGALAALARKEYGLCADCEEPVGYARLKARPEARYCRACMSSRESRRQSR